MKRSRIPMKRSKAPSAPYIANESESEKMLAKRRVWRAIARGKIEGMGLTVLDINDTRAWAEDEENVYFFMHSKGQINKPYNLKKECFNENKMRVEK